MNTKISPTTVERVMDRLDVLEDQLHQIGAELATLRALRIEMEAALADA